MPHGLSIRCPLSSQPPGLPLKRAAAVPTLQEGFCELYPRPSSPAVFPPSLPSSQFSRDTYLLGSLLLHLLGRVSRVRPLEAQGGLTPRGSCLSPGSLWPSKPPGFSVAQAHVTAFLSADHLPSLVICLRPWYLPAVNIPSWCDCAACLDMHSETRIPVEFSVL